MKKYNKIACLLSALGASLLMAHGAFGAVSADEASKLKTSLTPLGAERAGNADGSIPAWDGGFTKVDTSLAQGKRGDPFSADKPMFTITAQNMAQYADKLTPGIQAMFKKYPETYRLDIYSTRRTAAAPESVYEQTYKNATSAKLVDSSGGQMPDASAQGGIPFPIPKDGVEAIWNHLLRWRGVSWRETGTQYLITSEGKPVLTSVGLSEFQMPYYLPGGASDGVYWAVRLVNSGPPLRAGEAIVGRTNLDQDKSAAWTYLPGQRRVRKLPNACCDTPTPSTAGVMSFDELSVFDGRIDRFNWKLVGKKEMYIPYNNNKIFTTNDPLGNLGKHHLTPESQRWELHRVWVVEATLAPGKRHVLPKSTYYLDEDTWTAVLGDRYDQQGQLSKVLWQPMVVMPDIPAAAASMGGFYDLISGSWFVLNNPSGGKEQYHVVGAIKDSTFTPDAMAGEGIR
jgi:hypothetical protein